MSLTAAQAKKITDGAKASAAAEVAAKSAKLTADQTHDLVQSNAPLFETLSHAFGEAGLRMPTDDEKKEFNAALQDCPAVYRPDWMPWLI